MFKSFLTNLGALGQMVQNISTSLGAFGQRLQNISTNLGAFGIVATLLYEKKTKRAGLFIL
jgi:hypothetical protein